MFILKNIGTMKMLQNEPISKLEKWVYRLSIIIAAVWTAVQTILQAWN